MSCIVTPIWSSVTTTSETGVLPLSKGIKQRSQKRYALQYKSSTVQKAIVNYFNARDGVFKNLKCLSPFENM
jgi:hypothetical protein